MLTISVNLGTAKESSLQYESTPSEYLLYIEKARSSEPKEETIEAINDDDVMPTNVVYVVMKQEFSEVYFSLTPEYFPELEISSVENLMRPININSELINNNSFRNIYKLTLATSDLESF